MRKLLPRRSVRLRLTALYGVLFLLSGAVLLAITGGVVVATITPDLVRDGQSAMAIPVATAPIDASGNFVLRPDPTSRALSRATAKAIATNGGWVNLDLTETGADGKSAVTSITRQYVDASGKPLSLAEFRAAPHRGHWIGNGTGNTTTVDPKYETPLFSSQH